MIKNWLKKIIAETIRENFPPVNITIGKSPKDKIFVLIDQGTFVDSTIQITDNDKVSITRCYIETTEGFEFNSFVQVKEKEEA